MTVDSALTIVGFIQIFIVVISISIVREQSVRDWFESFSNSSQAAATFTTLRALFCFTGTETFSTVTVDSKFFIDLLKLRPLTQYFNNFYSILDRAPFHDEISKLKEKRCQESGKKWIIFYWLPLLFCCIPIENPVINLIFGFIFNTVQSWIPIVILNILKNNRTLFLN